jgi:hypothetical protein
MVKLINILFLPVIAENWTWCPAGEMNTGFSLSCGGIIWI